MPILADVLDGNSSDKTWNLDPIRELSAAISPEDLRRLPYVVDSQGVAKKTLDCLAKQGLDASRGCRRRTS